MYSIRKGGGFRNQIAYVIPRPVLSQIASHPLLNALLPTDIGWYPNALYHYFEWPEGAPEHILLMCTKGRGWYIIDDQYWELYENEALLIPENTPHIYGAGDADPWSIHWVHFTGSIGDFYAHQLPKDSYKLSIEPDTTKAVEQLFQECYDSILGGFVLQRLLYMSQALHHILGYLLFNNKGFSPALQTSNFHNLEHTLIFLKENINTRLTLENMADHAELSVSHFSRLFKDQTGYSPMDYFIRLKMQEACTHLILTKHTVREICFELGYDDPYYFSRVFKKMIGMSPRAYRKLHVPDRAIPVTIDLE